MDKSEPYLEITAGCWQGGEVHAGKWRPLTGRYPNTRAGKRAASKALKRLAARIEA